MPALMIPLYIYPTNPAWETLVSLRQAHPKVKMAVVINPASGSGSSIDQNYVKGVNSLKAAGITVLGYTHTGYGKVPISSVQTDIQNYLTWYSVQGIFYDQASSQDTFVSYYKSLVNLLPYTLFSCGNFGVIPSSSYLGIFDCANIYENAGLAQFSINAFFQTACGIYYSVPAVSSLWLNNYQLSYLYVTDQSLPNPYGALPSYFSQLVSMLDTQLA